jgi:hypothetical protein
MALFGISSNRFIGPNLRILAASISVFGVVALLFVFLAKTGYSRISTQFGELKSNQTQEKSLGKKVSILKQVQKGILDQTNTSLVAMPEKNPGALVMRIVKVIAEENSITLGKVELKGQSNYGHGITSMSMSTGGRVSGGVLSLVNFVNSLSEMAPIIGVGDIKLSDTGDDLSFSLEIRVFWAELPEHLPSISESIDELTPKEKELLARLSTLTKPSFETVFVPTDFQDRVNPFN